MKPYIYKICAAFALCSLLTGCYDEQDGNDFDTLLPDVSIVIPESAYSGSLGSTITIEPVIKTDIAESDLEYHWEVNGSRYNEHGRRFYASLVNDEQQGRTLNYTCKLDSNITVLNQSYACRLRVSQKSTGREFFSSSTFTITIEGITGLLVIYGDGNSSDIGVLQADEFMPSTSSLPGQPKATMGMYSMGSGKQLAGKGVQVIQGVIPFIQNYANNVKDRCRILARTDQEAVWLDRNDLSVFGDWNAVFYLQGERKVNDGQPRGYSVAYTWLTAFDGDNVFVLEPNTVGQYLFPVFTPATACNQGNKYTFAPDILHVGTGGSVKKLMYATSVNGDAARKGFVGLTGSSTSNVPTYSVLLDTRSDNVPFNPGDLKAGLVKMFTDSRGHVVAMLKGDSSNPTYGGKYFLTDLDVNASSAGESTYQGVPQAICDMSAMPGIDAATAFDFGSTQNMMYYATPNAVYHYGLDGKALSPAQPLTMTDGASLGISGEITMMKMLRSPNVTRHDTDEILLVATYEGSQSALYALHLDPMTGNVERLSKYDASNVNGWSFARIWDVNIKSL